MENLTSEGMAAYVGEIRERWSRAVGRIILAFGEIEWATYYALSELPVDRIFQAVVDLPFGKRVDLLRGILRGRTSSSVLSEEVLSMLNEAQALSGIRNLIAHNPQRMSIYADEHGSIVKVAEEMTHHHNEKRSIDYEELMQYAAQAEELERRVWSSIGRLVKESYAARGGRDGR